MAPDPDTLIGAANAKNVEGFTRFIGTRNTRELEIEKRARVV